MHGPVLLPPVAQPLGLAVTQGAPHLDPPNPHNQGSGPIPDLMPVPRHIQIPVAVQTPSALTLLPLIHMCLTMMVLSSRMGWRKVIAHKATWKSDTKYSAWQDELIHQGKEDIALQDKMVHNYAEVGKYSKAPNKIFPPLTYMEACRAFKPLVTTANPLGLWQFYHVDPTTATSAPTPNHPATIH